MFNVALTGGIASGKTAASNLFAELGANIIDTDIISRQLVQPGQIALSQISDAFGQQVIEASGQLGRNKLRQLIFTNPQARKQLEAILHPLIRQQAWLAAEQSQAGYNLFVVPLLYENQQHYPCDRVLVIDIPIELQSARLANRDKLSDENIKRILASQSTREDRLSIADDVIENTGSMIDLYHQVKKRHQQYLQLALEYPHAS
jgi:dephospho-CoA kinase